MSWPATIQALTALQEALSELAPEPWHPGPAPKIAGCFVCFVSEDAVAPAWAAAAMVAPPVTATVVGRTNGPYRPGLLALRAGPALEQAVRALPEAPDVLVADATGRDHPRRAGLAIHLGQVLDLPTVGVTHRTLLAQGDEPARRRGAHSPLTLHGEHVGEWLRIQPRARPIAVHAGWRTDPETAVEVVLHAAGRVRTPEPLRRARRLARMTRAETLSTDG